MRIELKGTCWHNVAACGCGFNNKEFKCFMHLW